MGEIQQIKEKIDIVELINQLVPLKKKGRNFSAPCPFHHERTPSFIVSPERQMWHCFGACNDGGDIFKFLMKWENIDFPEALKELAKRAHVSLATSSIEDESFKKRQRLLEINHLASEYYHYVLTKHPLGNHGRHYLSSRNIQKQLIKTFMLGYAPAAWDNVTVFLRKKGYKDNEIEQTGLIIKGRLGYYDRFRHRLMFTLKDHRGNIVGFSGRTLTADIKEAKYINSPETVLYHKSKILFGLDVTKDAIKKEGKVILCEGEFDVLSSYQAGISNIVAVKGTAITVDQLQLLKRITSELLLALDMDIAGDVAARRGIELAESLDFNVKIIRLTSGKDLDEAVQQNPSEVKKAIKHAVSVYDFIIDSALSRHDTTDAYAKKKAAAEVIPFIAKIGNEIIRNHYAKKLARLLDIAEDAVVAEIEKENRKPQSTVKAFGMPTIDQTAPATRNELLELYLLAMVIQSTDPSKHLQMIAQQLTIEELTTPAVTKIFQFIASHKAHNGTIDYQTLPPELADVFNRAYLTDITTALTSKEVFDVELTKTICEIRKTLVRRKLQSIATTMKKRQEEGIDDLNIEFTILQNELRTLSKD